MIGPVVVVRCLGCVVSGGTRCLSGRRRRKATRLESLGDEPDELLPGLLQRLHDPARGLHALEHPGGALVHSQGDERGGARVRVDVALGNALPEGPLAHEERRRGEADVGVLDGAGEGLEELAEVLRREELRGWWRDVGKWGQ